MTTDHESIFSSNTSEKRWVDQMVKIFEKDLIIEIDKPPCVFKVPKSISDAKPEAYSPMLVGLGPYHRWRPHLYNMERQKLASANQLLDKDQLQNLRPLVIDPVSELEPIIRSCYDTHLEHESESISWMLSLDSLYLINFLKSYPQLTNGGQNVDLETRKLVQDLFLLENQIPAFLLKEIRRAIDLKHNLFNEFLVMCKAHSPLKLCEQIEILFHTDNTCVHLLACMYSLILNNRGIIEVDNMRCPRKRGRIPRSREDTDKEGLVNIASEVAKTVESLGIGGPVVQMHLKFIQRVPWNRIFVFFRNHNQDDENDSSSNVEEIRVPSVTQLCEIAKVKFKVTEGGIRDLRFEGEGDNRTFHFPVIKINKDSEVILRNLIAYEAATATPGSTLELAEYVDFMCGIVDTPKDVALLREAKIIEGPLSDEEIAHLFNGISNTTGIQTEKKSNLELAAERVNEIFDNTRKVKLFRFFKKINLTSKKVLTVFLTIILLALLTLQAFCEVYGCSFRWFWQKIAW
ncbi:hypothetical protein ACH5RR_005771 [Cinchona calisaya]|uniref:Uncharacterized protein n=1 Tax=Cinchona calisaya TaxID=153742 RepID=A0ABD3AM23_9GENT